MRSNNVFLMLILLITAACSSFPPVQQAMFDGKKEKAHKIIAESSKEKINDPDEWAQGPLHWAAIAGDIPTMQLLLQKGAEVNHQENPVSYLGFSRVPPFKITPLVSAAIAGKIESAKVLIENGANLATETTFAFTPVMMAAVHNHLDLAKYLLEKGAVLTTAQVSKIAEMKICDDNTGMADGYLLRGENLTNQKPWGDHTLLESYRFHFCGGTSVIPINVSASGDYSESEHYSSRGDSYRTAFNAGARSRAEKKVGWLLTVHSVLTPMQGAVINNGGNIGAALKSTTQDRFKASAMKAPASVENISNVAPINNIQETTCACPSWAPWQKIDRCFHEEKSCGNHCRKCE